MVAERALVRESTHNSGGLCFFGCWFRLNVDISGLEFSLIPSECAAYDLVRPRRRGDARARAAAAAAQVPREVSSPTSARRRRRPSPPFPAVLSKRSVVKSIETQHFNRSVCLPFIAGRHACAQSRECACAGVHISRSSMLARSQHFAKRVPATRVGDKTKPS